MEQSDFIDPTVEQFDDFVIQDDQTGVESQYEYEESAYHETDDQVDQSYDEITATGLPSFEPDGEGVIKCGNLEKEGALELWSSRWFVIRTDGLFWYVNKHSREPNGSIPLQELQETLLVFRPKKDNGTAFGIHTKKKAFYVRAKTEWERSEWLTALQRVGCTQQGVPPYFFQPLPQGWEMRRDDFGKMYFVDHFHKKSTYEDPRKTASPNSPAPSPSTTPAASPSKPIGRSISNKTINYEPENSSPLKQTMSSGHIPKQPNPSSAPGSPSVIRPLPNPGARPQPTTPQPQSSSTTPAPPQLPLPQGWEMRQDNQGRTYFIDHVNKKSTYDDPRYNTQLFPLPSGWELRFDAQGRPYFIDHNNKKSTYDDPRVTVDYTQPPTPPSPSTAPLPKGWEMRYDPQGRAYFIDHNNKRSTYDDPRK